MSSQTDDRVLAAADRLFYERGIAGVSMAQLRDEAGVSLRRLYQLHPTKRELVAAWLTTRHEQWMAWLTGEVDRRVAATGIDPVLAAFDSVSAWAAAPGYRGCAFLNSLAEAGEIDATHRAIVAGHKQDLDAWLASQLRQGHPDAPAWLAQALGVLLDGAIVRAVVQTSTTPVIAARAAAAELLEHHP